MEFLNALFNGGSLSQEDFEKALSDKGIKLANLADGGYVSKSKYDNDTNDLKNTIKNRDDSISDLRGKLAAAGTEKTADEWQAEVDALKDKNKQDAQKFSAALAEEQYKNDCKDYARDIQFSSKGARNAFINAMVAKKLETKDGELIGADDFRKEYEKKDPDSFVKENPHLRFVDRQKAQNDRPRISLSQMMNNAE